MAKQRTIVVTGSASGIGAGARAHLKALGHRVIGVDRVDGDVAVDLATPDGRAALAPAVAELTGGSIDAVIACAGVGGAGPLVVQVNYFGMVATIEGLRPLLAKGTDPRVVAITSQAAVHPVHAPVVDACLAGDEAAALEALEGKAYMAYPSSKAAMCRWIRREAVTDAWAGAGIGLNGVAPGVVATPLTEPSLESQKGLEVLAKWVPMPYHGHSNPTELAPVLAFLASPENTVMTAQIIFVDGGADAVLRGHQVF